MIVIMYLTSAKKYAFDLKRGIFFTVLNSLKFLAMVLYLFFILLLSQERSLGIYRIYAFMVLLTYVIFTTTAIFSSYRTVSILTHLDYTQNLLNDFYQCEDEKKIYANKMKAVTCLLLLKEKLIKKFNSRFTANYILEFTRVENLELLAAKILWLDTDDNNSIDEIKKIIEEAIEDRTDIYPDSYKFNSFMDKIRSISNDDWKLEDKIIGKYHKNIFFTVIPIIIAIINLIPILVNYF